MPVGEKFQHGLRHDVRRRMPDTIKSAVFVTLSHCVSCKRIDKLTEQVDSRPDSLCRGSGYPLRVLVWLSVMALSPSASGISSEYSVNTLSNTPNVIRLSMVSSIVS